MTTSSIVQTSSIAKASRLEPPHDGIGDVVASAASGGSSSTAEQLKELRRAFPEMTLAERVAALAGMAQRRGYIPR